MESRFYLVSSLQADLRPIALHHIRDIRGFGEYLPALEGLGLKRKILGE